MSPQVSPAMEQRDRASSLDATVESGIAVRSKIWMPYGDIILQVGFTQFRVNRDVLAKHSSVFRDLFSVPQPANEPTTNGCHTVQLYDSADDWAELLAVLYEPFQTSASRPLGVVAAMLRLGLKYDIPESRKEALERLHYEFPATLDAWEKVDQLSKIQDQKGIHVDLLNLVLQCGVHSCVPALGFACLNEFYTLEMLLGGVRRDDGSRAALLIQPCAMLIVALERLLLFQRESLSWLKDEAIVPDDSCMSQSLCKREKMAINHSVFWKCPDEAYDLGYTLDPWDEAWSGKLCESCERAAKDYYEASRQKGWASLPSFFGLPEWKDLRDVE
ncbi:hypothetical protein B0H16DRAFT_1764886 [Mycena metata]|uniref:BTB domain-containing protein n=1 Tax=Mycena metata TaxID=1033252 RepID=A0AAD7MWZ1_9AGAR|nr:hypothetical protein B0H16DRAFT_1764886 [Mycena metata]